MLFNSYQFIFLFLPITFCIYFFLIQNNLAIPCKLFLITSSLFFYSWWNIKYLPIILFSMIFNYLAGASITGLTNDNRFKRKHLLIVCIAINLSLLGYFKYSDFFIENLNLLFYSNFDLLHLALPLAISFFTFQQITYLVDGYKGKIKENNFLDYALYVTFFPQLIAGPIVHHKKMMPQFSQLKNQSINSENIAKGLFIFSIGLFKKVVIADTFAVWSDFGFNTPLALNLIEAWVASLSFGFQLYFDFSGYADMAIGLGLFFNIKLPVNFRSPYKAINIQDFWKRWHITLSHFLRDYISLPLKQKKIGLHFNIIMTFLISGIWHGAGWTFIIWGGLHGTALVIQNVWGKIGFKLPGVIAWLITFIFLTIVRIFFRANTLADAFVIIKTLLFGHIVLPESLEQHLGFLTQHNIVFGHYLKNLHGNDWTPSVLLLALIIILCFKNSTELMENMIPNQKSIFVTVFLLLTALCYINREVQFYYFVF